MRSIGRECEAHLFVLRRRADRKEVDVLPAEIGAADNQDSTLLHRVPDGEQRREEPWFIVGLVHRAQVEAADRRLVGQRKIPRVDFHQCRRVIDHNLIGEDVQQLSVG